MTDTAVTSTGTLAGTGVRPWFGWTLHDGWVVAKRDLLKVPRVPELLFFSIFQPIVFVLLFAYVFGGAIPVPGGGSYREYLMAGIFVQTIAFNSASTTVGMAEDLKHGVIDRFRSLPMANSAVLLGRTTSDIVRGLLTLAVLMITGLVVGWRIHNGVVDAVAAVLLLIAFGFAMSWVGAWIGLYMPSPEVANTAGIVWLFPVTFLSNAFVPLRGMPGWVQVVAEWNPISSVVLACRELFGNPTGIPTNAWSQQHPLAYSCMAIAAILAVFVPLAVRKYRQGGNS
ncbi:MAG: ABC transporter permease [Actinomycetes bacterium]